MLCLFVTLYLIQLHKYIWEINEDRYFIPRILSCLVRTWLNRLLIPIKICKTAGDDMLCVIAKTRRLEKEPLFLSPIYKAQMKVARFFFRNGGSSSSSTFWYKNKKFLFRLLSLAFSASIAAAACLRIDLYNAQKKHLFRKGMGFE